jgi:hemolysin type calcium-binding protein
MRRVLATLAFVVAFGIAASPALADSVITESGGILYFQNKDAGIANRLTVDYDARGRVHFVDEADPYGISWRDAPCSPGKLNNRGNPVEVYCTKGSFSKITILIGPVEDSITYKIGDLPLTADGEIGADTVSAGDAKDSVHGGQGNDHVDGGGGDDIVGGEDGDDTLSGGAGNDRLDGGQGADHVNGGDGNDTVISADGTPDVIDCGAGTDTVNADTTDQITNCETITRTQVAPPAGGSGGSDSVRPAVQAGGSTRQRISMKRRRVAIAVSVSERAQVDVSGYLAVAGVNVPLKAVGSSVKIGGGGTTVRITLTRGQAKRVLADLRRHRRPRLQLTITAADPAGNTSKPRHLTIRLAR